MTFVLIRREASGLGSVVTNIDGSRRPRLRGARWFTIHYTGVDRSYAAADVPAHMRHQQQIWTSPTLPPAKRKPWQYNYVIGQTDDANVYEFAGQYQGAHSAGENLQAVGVYFLNGTGEPPTPTQIRKAQWLRARLIADGTLSPSPETTPHGDMPDANTSCPGPHFRAVMPAIRAPFQPDPIGDDDDMTAEQFAALVKKLDDLDAKVRTLQSQARTQAVRADWLNNTWTSRTGRKLDDIIARLTPD